MQAKRNDTTQQHSSVTGTRPSIKSHRSNQSNHSTQSTSLPSTPNHLPRINGASRSPSPPTCLLDSPRSAASEPVTATPYQKPLNSGCRYETALVNARRRMPYSLGFEKLNRESPKLDKLTRADEEKLTQEMNDEFELLKPSAKSDARRRKFLEKLGRILNEEWPGYSTSVHAFGSTENHLCMEDSDVDVCITTRCKDIEMTCKLAAALAKRGMERVVCVPGAKVPIVKIWDPEYKVACDMNVNNTLALDNTRMIKTYVEIDDRVRPLALVLKHWTKERILNDAATGGTLSSYTWICMILNFLQTREPPILPSLHTRSHKKKPPNLGVDVSFDDDIESLRGFGKDNKETLGGLLFAFFKKYGHELDYEKKVISVRLGKLLSKEDKNWQFLQNNRLCVEEPFNVGRNLGNTADDSSMRGIHLEFRRAHRILSEKAELKEVCERYEFPPEEAHSIPAPPPSRPVTLSRSNSNHGRNRNAYGSNGNHRGRGFQYNNNRGNSNSRRATNSTNGYNHGMTQPQQYPPEIYAYLSNHDQILAIQAQIQAHAQAQAQLIAHAQYHNHQQQQQQQHNKHKHQNQQSQSTPSVSNNALSNAQDAVNAFQFSNWQYLSHLYGNMSMYHHPGFTIGYETSTAPTSPPITPANPDHRQDHRQDGNRLGLGRGGRRNNHHNPTTRSHSQPPPLYATNYNRGMPLNGVAGSEDEDFGDHSSNGNPPETPPEEEPEQYVGYYSIGGTLQTDVAVVDPHVGEVEGPFMEQKSMVDRQKRYSSEKLPAPTLSRDPSPMSLNRQPKSNHDISPPLVLSNGLPNGVSSGPVLNGIPPPVPSVDSALAFDGFDGGSDSIPQGMTESKGASERRQLFAQKLLEVHTQAARSDGGSPRQQSQASSQLPAVIAPLSTTASVPMSPVANGNSQSDEDGEGTISPKLSPGLRQRRAGQTLLWTNSRTPPAVKNRGYSSSQEDLSLPLTPVPEVPTPSPSVQVKKVTDSKPAAHHPKSAANGKKAPVEDDPVPPTPAPAAKNGQKHGGRGKANGGKSQGAGNAKDSSESTKVDHKPNEKKSNWKNAKRTNKKRTTNPKPEIVKDSERKGG
ncbi:hypothetical protein EDC01DRAFT_616114 [Geopyxis carbonaria]|nr:hypothetical protein EDC01DRAFT_616114 [Geopyxis carbonaria]